MRSKHWFSSTISIESKQGKTSMHNAKDVVNEDPFDKWESVIYFHSKQEEKRKNGIKQGKSWNHLLF